MTIASDYVELIEQLPNEANVPGMIDDAIWEETVIKINEDATMIVVNTSTFGTLKSEPPRFYTFSDGSKMVIENYYQDQHKARAYIL